MVSPEVAPYLPAAHAVHDPAVAKLYKPVVQMAAVDDVEPATHAYPAVHDPEHVATARPAVAP